MSSRPSINAGLKDFSIWYSSYHGYVSLCVCFSGIITNIFNLTVLSRKHMRTPVNQILVGLAVSDIITMVSYVPFAVHFYVVHPSNKSNSDKNSYYWMMFLLFHINLTTVTHTVSIWLCVILSIIRHLHVKSPSQVNMVRQRRIRQAKYLVLAAFVGAIIAMIPNYLTNELKPLRISTNQTNGTMYVIKSMRLGGNDTDPLVLTNVWLYAFVAKLVPCLLISIFGSLLLYQLHVKVRQRKQFLSVSGSSSRRLQEHSRTTKMLISVILLFLVTELPQGVLIVLSATKKYFFDTVYLPLGDVMDIVALINNAVNFILYCSMSTKFRQTFINQYFQCKHVKPVENGYTLSAIREKSDSQSNNNQV
ncbi:G-protein coupled receptor dmsr-1-like [Gigantopelta aegis]|uniref:G-protein coupled receptor dmsr-1-like n=1 Tax=Gigantopelta aegis TaxID=1735272 RepID=UPI001B88D965|nr:G-protein coupled receptor dmsr-1-like [Gigantopelta aegis]